MIHRIKQKNAIKTQKKTNYYNRMQLKVQFNTDWKHNPGGQASSLQEGDFWSIQNVWLLQQEFSDTHTPVCKWAFFVFGPWEVNEGLAVTTQT